MSLDKDRVVKQETVISRRHIQRGEDLWVSEAAQCFDTASVLQIPEVPKTCFSEGHVRAMYLTTRGDTLAQGYDLFTQVQLA